MVGASAIPWSQYCGSPDVALTSFHMRFDGEDGDVLAEAHDDGQHCSCNDITGSYVNFTGKNYKSGDSNTIQFTGDGTGTNSVRLYAVDLTLAYTDASSPYYVVLGISTDPGAPYRAEKKVASGGSVTANLALGTSFSVGLVKKEPGQAGISTVVPLASSYAMASKAIAPAFETDHNLFDQDVSISLSGGLGQGTESKFVALHLGRAR